MFPEQWRVPCHRSGAHRQHFDNNHVFSSSTTPHSLKPLKIAWHSQQNFFPILTYFFSLSHHNTLAISCSHTITPFSQHYIFYNNDFRLTGWLRKTIKINSTVFFILLLLFDYSKQHNRKGNKYK